MEPQNRFAQSQLLLSQAFGSISLCPALLIIRKQRKSLVILMHAIRVLPLCHPCSCLGHNTTETAEGSKVTGGGDQMLHDDDMPVEVHAFFAHAQQRVVLCAVLARLPSVAEDKTKVNTAVSICL